MLLFHDIVHSDLHNGNILYNIIDNKIHIYFIDFGIVTNLNENIQKNLRELYYCLDNRDYENIIQYLLYFNVNKNITKQEINDFKTFVKNEFLNNSLDENNIFKSDIILKKILEGCSNYNLILCAQIITSLLGVVLLNDLKEVKTHMDIEINILLLSKYIESNFNSNLKSNKMFKKWWDKNDIPAGFLYKKNYNFNEQIFNACDDYFKKLNLIFEL